MTYTTLLKEADKEGLIVKELPLVHNNGRIKGNRIAIRRNIETTVEKACVLAEELGHHHTTTGDILDQNEIQNQKQERQARLWAFKKMVTIEKLISAFEVGCRNRYEIAEHIDVTEDFLLDALTRYKEIYGAGIQVREYLIIFDPLQIGRLL